MAYPRLTAQTCIDMQVGCLVRFVSGGMDAFRPHSHDFYEVFIVEKGTVPHMVKGVVQELPEGSLVFIRPDDIHAHRCDDAGTAFANLTFTKETALALLGYLFDEAKINEMLYCDMPPMVFLDKTNRKRLVSQISELNAANRKDKDALKIRMRTILVNVFAHFADLEQDGADSEVPLWLVELTNKMARPKNFVEGAGWMCALSGKSREHVARSLKQYYGVTVSDYINDLRVNYASNLLINTNASVTDVCYTCGFQSISYFCRVFKARNGVSPSEFRKRHKSV